MDQWLLPVMLLGALGLMMWFSSRTRKQQAQAMSFLDNPRGGERVMTRSGMYGTLVSVDGDTVTLEIAPGVETEWVRAAIAKLVEAVPVDEDADEDEYDEDEYEDDEYDEYDEDEAEQDEVGEDTDATEAAPAEQDVQDDAQDDKRA